MWRNILDTERLVTAVAFIFVVLGSAVDFFEDLSEGSTFIQLAGDLIISGFVAFALFYIWIQRPKATKDMNHYLNGLVRDSNQDLIIWKAKASKLLKGLGAEIDQQFNIWQLSAAEKEIALLLIKGASFKETAQMRGTNEKTVRQQASNVYAKANLDNRAELSAFFLEDLLLP